METKDIIGFSLLFVATVGCTVATCVSRRVRDVAFFFMISAAVISERLDINFFSRWWYRGSTRGVEVSFVDVIAISVLVSSFLFPVPGKIRWRWPPGLGPMLLFAFYALGATLSIEPRIFSYFELSKILRGLIFFLAAAMFVRSEGNLRLVAMALCCSVFLQGAVVVKQRWLEGLDRVAGTLDHANSLSMYLCMIGPVLAAAINSTLRKSIRWASVAALAVATLSIVLTVSRAGVPIFALVVFGTTVLCMTWRITLGKAAAIMSVALALPLVIFTFWSHLEERYTESTLSEDYDVRVIDSRGYYLQLAAIIVEDRFFGVGLNNWSYAVSKVYGQQLDTKYADYDNIPFDLNYDDDLLLSFAAPAHNLAALTVGELGVPGLLLFLFIWLRWFQIGASFLFRRSQNPMHVFGIGIFFGVVGVFLQSLTEWVFRQTPIYLTFHALVGVMASLYLAKREARRAKASEKVTELPAYELAEARA